MRFSFVPKNIFESVATWVSTAKPVTLFAIGLTAVAALAGVGALLFGQNEVATPEPRVPLVEIASVRSLSSKNGTISLLGRVRSESEATLRAEVSGQIVRVSYELGDTVRAGAVIAELMNSAERASLAEARAALLSAEAALQETEAGSGRTLATARAEAANAYRSAFITADDAIENKTEPFFIRDREQFPALTIAVIDGDSLERKRAQITEILREWEQAVSNLGTADMLTLLSRAQDDLRFIEGFLNDLASAANRRTSDTSAFAVTDTDRAGLLTARSNVSTELNALIVAENNLRRSLPADEPGATGERDAALAAREAAVVQARARVDTALAALERTIVRAPFSGTINDLELEIGNFVSANTPVATIANNNALTIDAFITAEERLGVSIGNEAVIAGRYRGVVTNIAPALDPRTNRVKVEIAIEDAEARLTHGDTVRVELVRDLSSMSPDGKEDTEIIIPITALKVETERIVVFSVSPESTLVAHPIVAGPLVGSRIVVLEGISPDMEIVLDARGLNEGEQVEVAER